MDLTTNHKTVDSDSILSGPSSLPDCSNSGQALQVKDSNVLPSKLNNSPSDCLDLLSAAEQSKLLKSKNGESHDSLRPVSRANDEIYCATTAVVKSIMTLSKGVETSGMGGYLNLVKNVGVELRNLLKSVDNISLFFPAQALR